MKKLLILNAILVVGFLHAQNDMLPAQIDSIAMHYANTITQEHLKGHLSILASDALEGRETGKRGQKMAAAYISSHFKELGFKNLEFAERSSEPWKVIEDIEFRTVTLVGNI